MRKDICFKFILFVMGTLLLVGCAPNNTSKFPIADPSAVNVREFEKKELFEFDVSEIKPGMLQEDVFWLLGRPTGTESSSLPSRSYFWELDEERTLHIHFAAEDEQSFMEDYYAKKHTEAEFYEWVLDRHVTGAYVEHTIKNEDGKTSVKRENLFGFEHLNW